MHLPNKWDENNQIGHCQFLLSFKEKIVYFLFWMKKNQEKLSLEGIFTSETTFKTLSEVFRIKNYNKLTNKIRNYQHLVLSLQTPVFSDIHQLQKIDNNLSAFDHVLQELQIGSDEMIQDVCAIGFRNYGQIVQGVMEVIRMMHEFIQRTVKETLQSHTTETIKHQKLTSNLCELCHEIQQANKLKKLKKVFGIDCLNMNSDEGTLKNKISKEEQDSIKDTEEFIDQLNALLSKKEKIASIPLNASKLNALVESLNKLSQFGDEICTKHDRKKKTTFQSIAYSQQKIQEENKKINQRHQKIVEEVREILNSKFQEGYSHRIKTMLEKFEQALKDDPTQKVEKKTYINMANAQCQTALTPETIQLKLVTDQLQRKEKELEGIIEGRSKMEERFMKVLENERKIIRDLTHSAAKNEHNHNEEDRMKLLNEIKKQRLTRIEEEATHEKQQLMQNQSDYYRSGLNSEMQTYKSLIKEGIRPRKRTVSRGKEEKYQLQTSEKYIQTEQLTPQKSQKAIEDQVEQIDGLKQVKRKKIRRYSKITLNSLLQLNSMSKTSSYMDHEQKSQRMKIDSNVVCFAIGALRRNSGTKAKRLENVRLSTEIQKDSSANNEILKHRTNKTKKETRQKKGKNSLLKKQFKMSHNLQGQSARISKTFDQPIIQRQSGILEGSEQQEKQQMEQSICNYYQQPNINSHDSVLESFRNSPEYLSKRSSAMQKFSRFAVPLLKDQFSKTSQSQFRYMGKFRMTETTNKKSYRINAPKNESQSSGGQIQQHYTTIKRGQIQQHYTTIKNKQNIIRINRYERKASSSMDKQKVKEIVSLLRSQKRPDTIIKQKTSKIIEKSEISENEEKQEENIEKILESLKQFPFVEKEEENVEEKFNILEEIKNAKALVEAEYSYLKATGFISYLNSLGNKLARMDRTQIKYSFQFVHINESDAQLFGGLEEMVRYHSKKGLWKEVIQQSAELQINCKSYNFAAKICKYLSLLKKMQLQVYKQYLSFLLYPVDFALNNFNSEVSERIKNLSESQESKTEECQKQHEQQLIQVIIQVLNFHHKLHSNCQHVAQFLQKIGYYRYALL